MEELDTNEQLNELSTDCTIDESVDCIEKISDNSDTENNSTSITEYKEVEEPCVALTIIGENRLTDAEIFIKRGIKYSIKAFFSAIVLTIMNLFILYVHFIMISLLIALFRYIYYFVFITFIFQFYYIYSFC